MKTLLLFLLTLPASAAPVTLEEFAGEYASLYFLGKVCTWDKCRYPELYKAHWASLRFEGDAAKFEFHETAQPKFRDLTIPKSLFEYYDQQGFGIGHDGWEVTASGDKVLEKTGKTEEGLVEEILAQATLYLRLPKFKQRKEDEKFDFGIELVYGNRLLRRLKTPEGAVLSETMIETSAEVENQYLRGTERTPQKPNF